MPRQKIECKKCVTCSFRETWRRGDATNLAERGTTVHQRHVIEAGLGVSGPEKVCKACVIMYAPPPSPPLTVS